MDSQKLARLFSKRPGAIWSGVCEGKAAQFLRHSFALHDHRMACASLKSVRRLGLHSPSGGQLEVLRRGTSRMDAARGLKGQGWPL